MSNLRRDDCLYGMSWVRVAGPLAVCLYQAAEDYCHRLLTGATISRAELEIALPWPLRPGELDAAIDLLVRLGRFEVIEDHIFLPKYFLEQESDEDQKSSRAKQVEAGKARAASASRDARGRLVANQPKSSHRLVTASHKLDSGKSPPASGPSGPGRAGPSVPSKTPDSAPSELPAAASPPREVPCETSLVVDSVPVGTDVETPQQMAMRFMLQPSTRNDGGIDRSWRFYAVRFVIATGGKPTFPTRHRKRWADILKAHGVEEFCRRVSIYFDDPPWKLRDGARDFGRLIENFDLLAAGSGQAASRESGDSTARFKWAVRERIQSMNGSAPSLSPEFASWVGSSMGVTDVAV